MTPTKKGQAMPTLEELATSESAQEFGFKFVSGDDVPPPPRERESDTERWNAIKVLLKDNPAAHGQWLTVKEYAKAGTAQAKASRINNDYEKSFPKSEGWEARSLVTRKKGENGEDDPGTSTLYLRYNPKTNK